MMTSDKTTREIHIQRLNGQEVKFFDLWEYSYGSWTCLGLFYAPKDTPNCRLVSYANKLLGHND
jgi:hypothetical protein